MTLSMLRREELHSLNTSGMHVAWSAAEGLNSAKAEVVEDAKRAKLTAAITFFLMVFMTFPRSLNGSLANRGCSYELIDGRMAVMPVTKMAPGERRLPRIAANLLIRSWSIDTYPLASYVFLAGLPGFPSGFAG
jgi:hypothetical protein